ncbi:30S ribosomal protein S16 [bacterium]|nr:30S ribosomal protein S16 [bacterium]
MPVRIRLRRVGAKKKPYYRIVAVDSRVSTRGKILELLGHYGPIENPKKVDIDIEKVDMWIKKGAQLSDTVRGILSRVKKSQEQGKVEKKPVEEGKSKEEGKEKVQKGKATRKITSSTKVVQGKKGSKGKQIQRKSKKKLARAH